VEGGQQMATAVDSRSSTKAVVTTAVQDEITIDHGVLSHQTMIEIRSGETVLVSWAENNFCIDALPNSEMDMKRKEMYGISWKILYYQDFISLNVILLISSC